MKIRLLKTFLHLLFAAALYGQEEYGIIFPPGYYKNTTQFSLVRNGALWGLQGIGGKEILPAKFEFVYIIDSSLVAAQKTDISNKFFFYNALGILLYEKTAKSIEQKEDGYIMLRELGKVSLINRHGKLILKPGVVTYVQSVKNKFIIAYKKNQGYGVLNTKGKIIIPFEYSNISRFDNGQFKVNKIWVEGVLNVKWRIVIPLDTQMINNCRNLYIVAKSKKQKANIFDINGNNLLEGNFSLGKNDDRELVFAKDATGRFQFYNAAGKIIIPFDRWQPQWSFDGFRKFSPNAIIVSKRDTSATFGNLYSAINLEGKIVIDFSEITISGIECNPNLLLVGKQARTIVDESKAIFNALNGNQLTNFGVGRDWECLAGGYINFPIGASWMHVLISPSGRKIAEGTFHDFKSPNDTTKSVFDENIILYAESKEGLVGLTNDERLVKAKRSLN